GHLTLHRRHQARMAVAQRHHHGPAAGVDPAAPVRVTDAGAGTLHGHRQHPLGRGGEGEVLGPLCHAAMVDVPPSPRLRGAGEAVPRCPATRPTVPRPRCSARWSRPYPRGLPLPEESVPCRSTSFSSGESWGSSFGWTPSAPLPPPTRGTRRPPCPRPT